LGRVTAQFVPIRPDPDGQVADTIAVMRAFALADTSAPAVREVVEHVYRVLLAQNPRATVRDLAASLWFWVKSCCRFERDEPKAAPLEELVQDQVPEVIHRPVDMLHWRRGDCDDFATLLASLLSSANIPNGFVTVANDPATPQEYSHVYNAAYVGGQRWALDAAFGPAPGWEASNRYGKRQDWPVNAMVWGSHAA
jgi:transglutaminase-like putative cysteine protease